MEWSLIQIQHCSFIESIKSDGNQIRTQQVPKLSNSLSTGISGVRLNLKVTREANLLTRFIPSLVNNQICCVIETWDYTSHSNDVSEDHLFDLKVKFSNSREMFSRKKQKWSKIYHAPANCQRKLQIIGRKIRDGGVCWFLNSRKFLALLNVSQPLSLSRFNCDRSSFSAWLKSCVGKLLFNGILGKLGADKLEAWHF